MEWERLPMQLRKFVDCIGTDFSNGSCGINKTRWRIADAPYADHTLAIRSTEGRKPTLVTGRIQINPSDSCRPDVLSTNPQHQRDSGITSRYRWKRCADCGRKTQIHRYLQSPDSRRPAACFKARSDTAICRPTSRTDMPDNKSVCLNGPLQGDPKDWHNFWCAFTSSNIKWFSKFFHC